MIDDIREQLQISLKEAKRTGKLIHVIYLTNRERKFSYDDAIVFSKRGVKVRSGKTCTWLWYRNMKSITTCERVED